MQNQIKSTYVDQPRRGQLIDLGTKTEEEVSLLEDLDARPAVGSHDAHLATSNRNAHHTELYQDRAVQCETRVLAIKQTGQTEHQTQRPVWGRLSVL
jgi:hypothetical protein